MPKQLLLLCTFFAFSLSLMAQRLPTPPNKKDQEKIAKRNKMNELMKNEEEGIPAFKKQSSIQLKMNHDGSGFLYELGKSKSPYKATVFQIELGEKQHPKEQKQSSTSYAGGGFSFFGRPFIYGKQNIFYQLKLGAGQQLMIGGKGNKNGVAVYGVLVGGLSIGLLRPYYMEFSSVGGSEKIKFSEKDRTRFLDPEKIIGGTGLSQGWSEMKTAPGFYAKTGLRFDWARFNNLISALEFGFSFDYYSKPVVQMVDVKGKSFFPTGYVSLVFGKRK